MILRSVSPFLRKWRAVAESEEGEGPLGTGYTMSDE
jgi:hypothetical protein